MARKILVPVLSRANYARLKSVLTEINNHPSLKLQLIVGASAIVDRYGCINTITKDGFEIDAEVHGLVDGDEPECMAITTGLLTVQLTSLFKQLNPDMVFVHADRFEQMATAIAASYTNRILVHSEGGESTGSIDNKVRPSITALADIHFPVTELAKQNIIKMGKNPDTVFVVGSPALDIIKEIDLTNTREEPYLLALVHPNTTDPEGLEPLIEALMSIPLQKVFVNSNTDSGAKALMKKIHGLRDVEILKNLPPEEFARLLYNCECAVGNSSSFIKEGAFFGTGAVIVGTRQMGREHGRNVRFVPNCADSIRLMIREMMGRKFPRDYRFGDGTAGKKIAAILSTIETREKKLCC